MYLRNLNRGIFDIKLYKEKIKQPKFKECESDVYVIQTIFKLLVHTQQIREILHDLKGKNDQLAVILHTSIKKKVILLFIL